jgi:hypothetical protein
MAFGYAVALRNARLNLVRDAIDADLPTNPGTVKIYDGTRPATGAAITDQVLLTTGTFSDPSAPNAAAGVLTFSAITYGDAVADGTATWARVADGSGAFVADGSVGTAGSGADFIMNSVGIVELGPVVHISAQITAGNP